MIILKVIPVVELHAVEELREKEHGSTGGDD
jgi:hypothetical protein